MQRAEIRIKGHLDESWSEWFEDFEVTYPDQEQTQLTGQVRDQAALFSLLTKIRDLGLGLVSVQAMEINTTNQPDTNQDAERVFPE